MRHRAEPGSRARARPRAPGTGVHRTVVRTARRAPVARGRARHGAEESRRTLDLDLDVGLGVGLGGVQGAGIGMGVGVGEGGWRGDGGLGLPLSCNASVASSQTASALHDTDTSHTSRQRQREAALAELAHSTARQARACAVEAAQDRASRCVVALPGAVSSGFEPVGLAAWLVVSCVLAGWRAAAPGGRGQAAAAAYACKAKQV